ncbi:uncharacterized protein LOC128960726 [Oppia nitens]|uniref:uncharacterized protein LOC128960726 n=1 Tax=Oppia nitens TaxID=1686743 RepID=UPI0023D983E3|nr:uncharacterized protein LOC128960726 [Oppia nitens]
MSIKLTMLMMMMTTIMMVMEFTVPVDCVKGQYLHINLLTGEKYLIECDLFNDTVDDLKQHIRDIHGFDLQSQRLIRNGKELEGDKQLADYNINNYDTLYLVKKNGY